MARSNGSLKDRLARYRQIKLSVIGRKSAKTISIPVWFVLEGEELYLLPVQEYWLSRWRSQPCLAEPARLSRLRSNSRWKGYSTSFRILRNSRGAP